MKIERSSNSTQSLHRSLGSFKHLYGNIAGDETQVSETLLRHGSLIEQAVLEDHRAVAAFDMSLMDGDSWSCVGKETLNLFSTGGFLQITLIVDLVTEKEVIKEILKD